MVTLIWLMGHLITSGSRTIFTRPAVFLRRRTPLVEAAWTFVVMWSNSTSNSHSFVTHSVTKQNIPEIFRTEVNEFLLWTWRERWRMILRLLSFLPEPAEVFLASPPPPKCQFLKDPPSVVKTAQRKTQITKQSATKDLAMQLTSHGRSCHLSQERGGKRSKATCL